MRRITNQNILSWSDTTVYRLLIGCKAIKNLQGYLKSYIFKMDHK